MGKKDKERKPDYDEATVPKVLKEPIAPLSQPLSMRKDYGATPEEAAMVKEVPMEDIGKTGPADYDEPPCGCSAPQPIPEPITEEVVPPMGEEGVVTILVCPECENEGPFNMAPPQGIPLGSRKLKCAKCKTIIPMTTISKTASGKYTVVTAHCMDSQFKAIKKLVKPGELSKSDASKIVSSLDKIYDKYIELEKKIKE
jgi:hypothetical protein